MTRLKLDKSKIYTIVLLLAMAIVGYYRSQKAEQTKDKDYIITSIKGNTMGTYYDIRYLDTTNYQTEIDSVLANFNNTFSTYIPSSTISQWNNDSVGIPLPKSLLQVINRSLEIAAKTDSMFDPFASPMFALWSKHKKEETSIPQSELDSVIKFSGLTKIELKANTIFKKDNRVQMNLNAIAKGYGCDVLGKFLESRGINNYKVEIGGEIACKGSKKGEPWVISIESPTNQALGEDSFTAIGIKDVGMATSGNYRNYYKTEDGTIYTHTINPKTGHSVQNDLLSVTVIAPDCMTADAYATAFMVLGMNKSKKIVEASNDLEAFFIYGDGQVMKSFASAGFEKLILK